MSENSEQKLVTDDRLFPLLNLPASATADDIVFAVEQLVHQRALAQKRVERLLAENQLAVSQLASVEYRRLEYEQIFERIREIIEQDSLSPHEIPGAIRSSLSFTRERSKKDSGFVMSYEREVLADLALKLLAGKVTICHQ